MFTVCPKCALTLVVTAADLRVAQGYVRCGRCSSVFNALAQLSDERAAAAAAAAPPAPEEPEEPPESEEPAPPPAPAGPREGEQPESPAGRGADEDPIPDDALEFNPASTDVSSLFVEPPPHPEWTAATGSFKALAAAAREPVRESAPPDPAPVDVELDAALLSDIMDTGSRAAPAAAAPREMTPAAKAAPTPAAAPARAPAPAPADAAARAPPPPRRGTQARPVPAAVAPAGDTRPPVRETPPPAPDAWSPHRVSSPSGDEAAAEDSAPSAALAAPRAARAVLPWAIGAALLIVLLPLQVIDHERDALAANARFSQPLTRFYSMLGVRLMPRWDLSAYDIHQLGATVEPGSLGAITVRASIRNVGARAQPPPLLRVTLQDRFGNRLASREVPPRDYLPRSLAPPVLMAVDQRIDAELAFVDPGASAVGFELDACLPARGGGVACANDASAR